MDKIFPPHLLPVYNRIDFSFVSGEGVYLIGQDGRRYLDCVAGIAVSSLGHSHPHLVSELRAQLGRFVHLGNAFRVPEQERLATRICERSFADSIYFCNSGAEANEGAIKMARRTHFVEGNPARTEILTFANAFHGRTLAALAATGNATYSEGFMPLPGGFRQLPEFDLDMVAATITRETAAVMVEVIQAEGGVITPNREFFRQLRTLCDRECVLLIVDEVQTGFARSGPLFGYEWAEIEPDIMSLAKGLGGGVPIGATAVSARVAHAMTPGTHGSTFSGNLLAMAAGNAVMDVLTAPGADAKRASVSARLFDRAKKLAVLHPQVFGSVRGRGHLLGIECKVPNTELVDLAFARALLCHTAKGNMLRLLPPLVITEQEVDLAFDILEDAANYVKLGERA